MKINYKNILIALVLSAGLTGCTKDFDETNNNPNKLEFVAPGT